MQSSRRIEKQIAEVKGNTEKKKIEVKPPVPPDSSILYPASTIIRLSVSVELEADNMM